MSKPGAPLTVSATTLKAIDLITRASLIRAVVRNPPLKNPDYPLAVWGGSERTEIEHRQVEHALQVFIDHLPPELTVSILADKSISNACASMQYLVGAAQILLYDTNCASDDNARALKVIRRLVGVMHLLGDRSDWGDVGLFVVMIWDMMARLLIREALRLESIGDAPGEFG